MGIGNLARIKGQRAIQSGRDRRSLPDPGHGCRRRDPGAVRVQSAAVRVSQADRSLRSGIITYNGQLEGLSETKRFGNVLVSINRPQEAVYAPRLLRMAFDEYFSAVAEYNRAQFDLYHALGYPAQEISTIRRPGDVLPVDKTRPAFLPLVGNGPPPATK